MTIQYPPAWSRLQWPWVRMELLGQLDELADPLATAKWLRPDPRGPIIGIDQQFHFFFDDHDFDREDIGYSLFDADEVTAIASVKDALEQILNTNEDGDDPYFLEHPLWPRVVDSATRARDLLSTKGVPEL